MVAAQALAERLYRRLAPLRAELGLLSAVADRRYRGGVLSCGHQKDTLHEALLLTIIIIAANLWL